MRGFPNSICFSTEPTNHLDIFGGIGGLGENHTPQQRGFLLEGKTHLPVPPSPLKMSIQNVPEVGWWVQKVSSGHHDRHWLIASYKHPPSEVRFFFNEDPHVVVAFSNNLLHRTPCSLRPRGSEI